MIKTFHKICKSPLRRFYRLCIVVGTLFFLLVPAESAWAVQAHGGAEGLVSHQIGHMLFVVGMGYLLFRLQAMKLKGTGWFEFKVFLWLLLAWNLMTFSGHWMNELVAREKFIQINSRSLSFSIENLPDAMYYLTRLDHLLLVPSFTFLLLALRKWKVSQ